MMERYEHLDSRDLAEEAAGLREAEADGGLDAQDNDRLQALEALFAEVGVEEFELISGEGFEFYARELAEECGLITGNEGWPLDYIDWERAADALSMDYTLVRFDGTDYYSQEV